MISALRLSSRPGFLPLILGLLFPTVVRAELAESPWPAVPELGLRLRTEIPDLAGPAEGETNALTYLRSLAPRVLVGLPENSSPAGPALTRSQFYPGQAAYLRVAGIDASLPGALREALVGLARTGTVAGIVLDLRYAAGEDYASAASAAGVLADHPVEPFRLGSLSLSVPAPAAPRGVPVMVLVHGSTRGAAEALAAAVRASVKASLLIGAPTAGEARTYRSVEIPGGRTVRVAGDPLQLPDGKPFPLSGLAPDLEVRVPADVESRYYTNEFYRPGDGSSVHELPGFRLNEAELVRRMRGPQGKDRRGSTPVAAPVPTAPTSGESVPERTIADPVLSRALDLIAGYSSLRAEAVRTEAGGVSR